MLPSTESAHALSRLLDLADALSAGIDPDFDPGFDLEVLHYHAERLFGEAPEADESDDEEAAE